MRLSNQNYSRFQLDGTIRSVIHKLFNICRWKMKLVLYSAIHGDIITPGDDWKDKSHCYKIYHFHKLLWLAVTKSVHHLKEHHMISLWVNFCFDDVWPTCILGCTLHLLCMHRGWRSHSNWWGRRIWCSRTCSHHTPHLHLYTWIQRAG